MDLENLLKHFFNSTPAVNSVKFSFSYFNKDIIIMGVHSINDTTLPKEFGFLFSSVLRENNYEEKHFLDRTSPDSCFNAPAFFMQAKMKQEDIVNVLLKSKENIGQRYFNYLLGHYLAYNLPNNADWFETENFGVVRFTRNDYIK